MTSYLRGFDVTSMGGFCVKSAKKLSGLLVRLGLVAALAGLALGCAADGTLSSEGGRTSSYEYTPNDPLEDFNRHVFNFNDGIDKLFLRPVGEAYATFLPDVLQIGTRNVLNNLQAPITLVGDILQGKLERALTTTMRFGINTVLGGGGFNDVAAEMGLPGHKEDFGQTFAYYGANEGPYLVLPFLGPSNVRDAIGLVPDYFLNPWTHILHDESLTIQILPYVVTAVATRALLLSSLDNIERNSVDYYASIRSITHQRREYLIGDGTISIEDLPDIEFEDFDEYKQDG